MIASLRHDSDRTTAPLGRGQQSIVNRPTFQRGGRGSGDDRGDERAGTALCDGIEPHLPNVTHFFLLRMDVSVSPDCNSLRSALDPAEDPRLLTPITSLFALGIIGVLSLAAYTTWLVALTPTERSLWIILAIFVAALVSSIAGFAFSAICGAMLFHLIDDPVQAVQIMMICSVGGQSLMVWALRHEIAWHTLSIFLLGAALGLPLGIFVLLHTRPALYAQVVGAFLVLYAVFMILRHPMIVGARAHFSTLRRASSVESPEVPPPFPVPSSRSGVASKAGPRRSNAGFTSPSF